MNELITGYNLPHLAKFSQGELDALAEVLPKGLVYRMYGGEESRTFTLTLKVLQFLEDVDGSIVYVWTLDNAFNDEHITALNDASIPIKAIEYENERYIFDPPTWRDGFWKWFDFNFRKAKYYSNLAVNHIWDWASFVYDNNQYKKHAINLPLKVNQNIGFRFYAKQWLYEIGLSTALDIQIDLHVFGDDLEQFRQNLEWYKANTNRTINIYEFNGLENNRAENDEYKNSNYHDSSHRELLEIAKDVLGDQLGDVLYFTLASGRVSQTWSNPPYLNKYETKLIPGGYAVVNTIENVMI